MKNKIGKLLPVMMLTFATAGLLNGCSNGGGGSSTTNDSDWTIAADSDDRDVAIIARYDFLNTGSPTSLDGATRTPADLLSSYDGDMTHNCKPAWRKSGTLFWVDEDDIADRVYEVIDRDVDQLIPAVDTAKVYDPYTGGNRLFTSSEDVTYTCIGSLMDAETQLDEKYKLSESASDVEKLEAVRDLALDQLAMRLGSTAEERNDDNFLMNNANHISYTTSCAPEQQHFSWIVLPDYEVQDALTTSMVTAHSVVIVPSGITEWATYGYSVDMPSSITNGVAEMIADDKFVQSGKHTCVFVK